VKCQRVVFENSSNRQETYSGDMVLASPIEDHRGVDVAQIRTLLAMSRPRDWTTCSTWHGGCDPLLTMRSGPDSEVRSGADLLASE
jgi:hypothetical protein